MPMRIKLPHGEVDPIDTYSMPDPDALVDTYFDARRAVFPANGVLQSPPYPDVTLTYSQAVDLLALAEGYLTLTTYELGQECCVEKLRDIWRARRARAAEEGTGEG